MWLNDKNAVIGLSKMNPLRRDSPVNKSLSKKPKPPTDEGGGRLRAAVATLPPPSGVPPEKEHCKPWKPAQPAKL
jgi:hypothetical protein